MPAQREIEVEATPEEVWDALATEEGRDAWLDEPGRDIHVESADAPHRLVWWWGEKGEAPTRVEFLVVPLHQGSRVVVIESEPAVPLATLCARFELALA